MIDALATLHRAGWPRAGLWVYADNARARRFYERGGWALGGVERNGRIGSRVVVSSTTTARCPEIEAPPGPLPPISWR